MEGTGKPRQRGRFKREIGQADFLRMCTARSGLSYDQMRAARDAIVDTAVDILRGGRSVRLMKLAVFFLYAFPGQLYRDINTGEKRVSSPRWKIAIRISEIAEGRILADLPPPAGNDFANFPQIARRTKSTRRKDVAAGIRPGQREEG